MTAFVLVSMINNAPPDARDSVKNVSNSSLIYRFEGCCSHIKGSEATEYRASRSPTRSGLTSTCDPFKVGWKSNNPEIDLVLWFMLPLECRIMPRSAARLCRARLQRLVMRRLDQLQVSLISMAIVSPASLPPWQHQEIQDRKRE